MRNPFNHTGLYGITDHALSGGRGNVESVRIMLESGIRVIQYREKERKAGVMLEECLAIRRLTAEAGAVFIVNDHLDLALLCKADGVHIGQEDLPPRAVRELIGPRLILGLSTHSPEQGRAALEEPVDYIGVGPIFATKTKKDVCDPVGLEYLDFAVKNLDIPQVAIGGIKAGNIGRVAAHGARLVAVVSGIVSSPDPAQAIEELNAAMREGAAR